MFREGAARKVRRAGGVAYFIDEEDARDELRYALIDVTVNDLVDFLPEFLGNFGFLRFH